MKQGRNQRGAVTAETAVAMPVLIVLAAALAWLVSLGVTQVRAVDAARESARAMARGETEGAGRAIGERVAPAGARFLVAKGDGEVKVTVTAEVKGPGGIFGFLPTFTAHSTVVAQVEP